MKAKGKYIGWLLFMSAGLIILAHAVIPHDHHFDCFDSSPTCCCENLPQDQRPENPLHHCHAFNTLVGQDRAPRQDIQSLPLISIIYYYLDQEINLAPLVGYPLSYSFEILFSPGPIYISGCSLRAPPRA
ncbi:hypothetical protein ACT29H_13305 [Thermophagus sp. OGC60D27]|uniref:hypothetical protein n=1 Tax=Thermophagus sp. OGC60D27 TaxID=3458415 RepID=UPI0040382F3B